MASAVATPLENQFSTIAGLDSMTSINSLGTTQITLEFDLNRNLDGAAVDVQAAITQASRLLPQGMPTPPTFTKVNPADQPILYLALTSRRCRSGRWTNTPRRASRNASPWSAAWPRCRCWARRSTPCTCRWIRIALAAHQIGINEVETALKQLERQPAHRHHHRPAARLHPAGERPVDERRRSTGRSSSPTATESPVRLEELGTLIDSVEDDKTASWFYHAEASERAIILGIQRQPGTNTIEVTDGIKKLLPHVQSRAAALGQHGHPLRPLRHHPRIVSRTCSSPCC